MSPKRTAAMHCNVAGIIITAAFDLCATENNFHSVNTYGEVDLPASTNTSIMLPKNMNDTGNDTP